jgi:hypothetical protein
MFTYFTVRTTCSATGTLDHSAKTLLNVGELMGSPLRAFPSSLVQILGEPLCFKIISRLGQLDHEAVGLRDFRTVHFGFRWSALL